MGNYTRQVKDILSANGCYFVRYGKGDHEVWHSPITNKRVVVDGTITKRTSANKTLKGAGINQKV